MSNIHRLNIEGMPHFDGNGDLAGFLGLGKEGRERRKDRRVFRKEKRAAKLERKKANTQNLLSKAEARTILAGQGVTMSTTFGDIAKTGVSLLQAKMGIAPTEEDNSGGEYPQELTASAPPINPMYIGLALLVVVGLFLFMRKS